MSDKKKIKCVEILLIEDNPGDVRLTIEALKESKILNNLNVVRDGDEAMAYLRKEGKYKYSPPELILLDLNLPKKDGREVLADIKQDNNLKRIPVVILTTSIADEDILKTYQLHANCYISKPVNMEQFIKVVKSIGNFWFSIVKLPPNGGASSY
jgi:CheY-like chemotaxis protein